MWLQKQKNASDATLLKYSLKYNAMQQWISECVACHISYLIRATCTRLNDKTKENDNHILALMV